MKHFIKALLVVYFALAVIVGTSVLLFGEDRTTPSGQRVYGVKKICGDKSCYIYDHNPEGLPTYILTKDKETGEWFFELPE